MIRSFMEEGKLELGADGWADYRQAEKSGKAFQEGRSSITKDPEISMVSLEGVWNLASALKSMREKRRTLTARV